MAAACVNIRKSAQHSTLFSSISGGGGDLAVQQNSMFVSIVADPGSGAFLTPGSGIRIQGTKSGSGIRNEHPRSFVRELRNDGEIRIRDPG